MIYVAAIGGFYLVTPDNWIFATHGDVADAKRRADLYVAEYGTYNGAEAQIEEFVRQWVLAQLLAAYKYPPAWVGERIIIEEPVKMGATEKEADVSIKNANRRTFLYVETKKRGISEEEFKEAERQLETYLASTHTATIGMVTDGDRVRTLRKKIDPNDFEYIPDLPAYGLEARTRTQLVRELPAGTLGGRSTGLRVLNDEYERVLFDCHSAARDTDGLHADEALDEICKVLYAKIFDERAVTKQAEGTPFRFQTYGASNASEVASNIRVLYEEARTTDTEIYSKRIPGYERSRGVFKTQIRLSDAALFRVVERLQEFSLIDSKADIKGRAFQRILGPAIRAGMGQYFTPDPIVELAIRVVQPRASDLLLDPFCGSGHFLTKALQYVVERQGAQLTAHDLHEFKFFHLHGIEKSDRMVRIAMTDMMLNDDDFHLPAEGIRQYPKELLKRVDEIADIAKDKRDPTKEPDIAFQYVDIAAVDVVTGVIANPQDLEGNEAPSRARKVLRAFDILVSTCRPTRGAIAVVPVALHNHIASTGFSIVRPHVDVNPFYLHYALRLSSTLEQFRKWSTGSSYPAILDADVSKTLVPIPAPEVQDAIAKELVAALRARGKAIAAADGVWLGTLSAITVSLTGNHSAPSEPHEPAFHQDEYFAIADVRAVLKDLPSLQVDANGSDMKDDLLEAL